MFGYFDPASLDIGRRNAAINFISASNADDVTTVKIDTPEKAREIASKLRAQKQMRFSSLMGDVKEHRGSIAFSPAEPREALMHPFEAPSKLVPIKLAFAVKPGELPAKGSAILQGIEIDGAIFVSRLLMRQASPKPPLAAVPEAGTN